jgi:hypothetical protein
MKSIWPVRAAATADPPGPAGCLGTAPADQQLAAGLRSGHRL